MPEVTIASRVRNLVFSSPYFLLIFLFVPATIIASHLLHLPYKMNLLLFNNACFLVLIALRFAWYLSRLNRADRYGSERGEPKDGLELARPASQLRSELAGKGYRFDASGAYGEKPEPGYLGTVCLYGGLLVLLFFGSYDNLMQYSGVVRQGIGDPASISKPEAYGELVMGPAASSERLPLLQVRKILLPNREWPRGAVEIGLWSKEGKMLASGLSAPGKSLRYGGFEYDMLKFSYVADIRAVTRDNQLAFSSVLTLLPLPEKKGAYTHYTQVSDPSYEKIAGDAWFNPEKKALKVVLSREGKPMIDTELELWGKNTLQQGEYALTFSKLGQFAEIRVAHDRHFKLLEIGVVLALMGAVLRLLVRPQRVWLEETAVGCRAKATGSATKKILAAAGR